MKVRIVGLTSLCLMSGCAGLLPVTQATLDGALADVRTATDETRSLVNRTRSQLSEIEGLTQEQRETVSATLAVLEKAADATDVTLDDIEERLEPLLTADDLPSAIQGIGTVLAPLSGPLAPWILLATNLLSVGLTRRRTQTTTANHLIAPMEASRNRAMEADLAKTGTASGKGNFIVLNRDVLAPAHAANGARAIIKSVTG